MRQEQFDHIVKTVLRCKHNWYGPVVVFRIRIRPGIKQYRNDDELNGDTTRTSRSHTARPSTWSAIKSSYR